MKRKKPSVNQTMTNSAGGMQAGRDINITDSPATKAKLDEIARLLREQSPNTSPEKLLAEYPGGYVIFELNYQNSVWPYDKNLLAGYEVDWKAVSLEATGTDTVSVTLPSITGKGNTLIGNRVGMPKVVGARSGGVGAGRFSMSAKILAITDNGIVFLIGVKEFKLPKM